MYEFCLVKIKLVFNLNCRSLNSLVIRQLRIDLATDGANGDPQLVFNQGLTYGGSVQFPV
jgi:hypothetical protein